MSANARKNNAIIDKTGKGGEHIDDFDRSGKRQPQAILWRRRGELHSKQTEPRCGGGQPDIISGSGSHTSRAVAA